MAQVLSSIRPEYQDNGSTPCSSNMVSLPPLLLGPAPRLSTSWLLNKHHHPSCPQSSSQASRAISARLHPCVWHSATAKDGNTLTITDTLESTTSSRSQPRTLFRRYFVFLCRGPRPTQGNALHLHHTLYECMLPTAAGFHRKSSVTLHPTPPLPTPFSSPRIQTHKGNRTCHARTKTRHIPP